MTLYPGDPKLGLNNIQIGGEWNHRVGVGFKAKISSPLAAIRYYLITKGTGYAGGTGGNLKYELWSDANGKPGQVITAGKLLVDAAFTEWVNAGGFPLIGFPSFPQLTAGKWYHFVITNTDPQPKVNFQSFDSLLSKTGTNPDPNSFIEFDTEGVNWERYKEMMAEPFGVFYANGELQGNGGYQIAPDGSTQCGKEYGFGKLC